MHKLRYLQQFIDIDRVNSNKKEWNDQNGEKNRIPFSAQMAKKSLESSDHSGEKVANTQTHTHKK